MKKPKLKVCPGCGQKKLASVLYGMPTEEAWAYVEAGLLVSHGCCLPEQGDPEYVCTACGHEVSLWPEEPKPQTTNKEGGN